MNSLCVCCCCVGITVDSEDLLLVSVKDSMKNPEAEKAPEPEPESDHEDASSVVSSAVSSSRKRSRKRRKSSNDDEDADAVSEPKTPRNDSDYDTNSVQATPSSARRALYSADDSRASFSADQSGDGFTLSEMKQDYDGDDDDDLVEFIKEEPGFVQPDNDGSRIVSIQSLHSGAGIPGMTSPPMPGMPMPGGMPMGASGPPIQMGDLNEVSTPDLFSLWSSIECFTVLRDYFFVAPNTCTRRLHIQLYAFRLRTICDF